jgi:hypothetical protein
MSLQISIFEILSCVLSSFLGPSANSFLHFQKTFLFKTLRNPSINIAMNLSTCCVTFRWHHTVEISSKIITNVVQIKPDLKIWRVANVINVQLASCSNRICQSEMDTGTGLIQYVYYSTKEKRSLGHTGITLNFFKEETETNLSCHLLDHKKSPTEVVLGAWYRDTGRMRRVSILEEYETQQFNA